MDVRSWARRREEDLTSLIIHFIQELLRLGPSIGIANALPYLLLDSYCCHRYRDVLELFVLTVFGLRGIRFAFYASGGRFTLI